MPAATVHTATYEADKARVRINLSGFATGTTSVQITRTDAATGRVSLVRGARSIPITTPASDTVLVYDYEFEPGDLVTYKYFQTPDATAYTLATAAAYDLASVWLKHVTRPYLNTPVEVVGFQPFEHQLRANISAAVRSVLPIGSGDARAGRTCGITVTAADADTRKSLDDILKVGGVLLLHRPADCLTVPDADYVMATAATERMAGRVHSGRRYFDLQLAEVAPPDADVAGSGITWNDVVGLYATWNDLVAAVPTWNDLLAVVANPVEVVVS